MAKRKRIENGIELEEGQILCERCGNPIRYGQRTCHHCRLHRTAVPGTEVYEPFEEDNMNKKQKGV